eukprot:CAMPEP_0172204558 /NCGR_PEP_ID=MMETSP1050-20130122/32033_1 /TAXON_ID=233186 /ORGANISM="Cryptomonas curvata, Strain CCAP979/52" /LENGTH=53 /DNA_ID=CAMNT_0012883151 /DNA_START=243 /DNA_END=401 /DNA_ORIENTATION=-
MYALAESSAINIGTCLRLRGGIFDPWEITRMTDLPLSQSNVTADIVEDWTLEK